MTSHDRQPTLSGAERIIIALVFLAAIGVSIVVVARLGGAEGEVVGPPEDRPMVDESVPRPVPLVDGFEVALDWAREWNPNAWPILVSTQFEFPVIDGDLGDEASQGMFIFTFASPEESGEWPRLTLAVSRQSGNIYFEDDLRSKVEPPGSIEDLLLELPVSAEQAFRIADEVIGEEYREGCAEQRRAVQVILDSTDRDAPKWVVVYYDQRERTVNDVVMRIDGNSGATSTEQRDDPSCESASG